MAYPQPERNPDAGTTTALAQEAGTASGERIRAAADIMVAVKKALAAAEDTVLEEEE